MAPRRAFGRAARVNISINVGQRLADTIGEEIGDTVYLVTAQRGEEEAGG